MMDVAATAHKNEMKSNQIVWIGSSDGRSMEIWLASLLSCDRLESLRACTRWSFSFLLYINSYFLISQSFFLLIFFFEIDPRDKKSE
jgi:hypothetical protein